MKKICVRVSLLCRVLDFYGALPGVILAHQEIFEVKKPSKLPSELLSFPYA